MSNLRANADGIFEARIGSNFNNVIVEARQLAQSVTKKVRAALAAVGLKEGDETRKGFVITIKFNGVTVSIDPLSDLALIERDWNRARSGYLGDDSAIGPHPKAELSFEELARDAEIEAANKVRDEKETARRRAAARMHYVHVTARMQDAPAMEFASEEGRALWRSWVDADCGSYGAGTLTYAERWARMMQLEMSTGKSLKEVYATTSGEADLEGMSHASSGMAEQLLVQTWRHGAELDRVQREYCRMISSCFSGDQS